MSNTITNEDDVIDSREIIERIEELISERGEPEDGAEDSNWDGWDELKALQKLAEEASSSPDWNYSETLIRRSYFVDYIAELIDECYELPKELTSGQWPYRHITIDYKAAAEEAEQDYMSVDFDGVEYLIRA
jgi:hypothetical protein